MSEYNRNVFDRRFPYGVCKVRKKEEPGVTYGGVLIHYGISGQKWGLRRFQNEDRTLTEEGKARYSKEGREERKAQKQKTREEKAAAKAQRKAEKEAAKPESARWKASEAGFLSDEELNRRNSRLQREQQYRNMTKSNGRKFLEGLGKATSKILVGSLVGAVSGFVGMNYASKINEGAKWLNDNVGLMKLKVNEKAI